MAIPITAGNMNAVSGMITAYGEAQAQQAAAIQQQTAFMLQARDTLAISEVRSDMALQYATLQAGRTLRKAETEAMNYKIAGNQLLRNLRQTNASIRARAAASGVSLGSGSVAAIQQQNTDATMQDLGVADLNALTAQVLGFEDASAMLQSTQVQGILDGYTASRQAGQYNAAAAAARSQGNLMANATLMSGATNFAKTLSTTTAKPPAKTTGDFARMDRGQ